MNSPREQLAARLLALAALCLVAAMGTGCGADDRGARGPRCGDGFCSSTETAADCTMDCSVACTPGALRCQGNVLLTCENDGLHEEATDCDPGQICTEQGCTLAPESPADAGFDASPDASPDISPDISPDAGEDVAEDTSADTAVDSGVELDAAEDTPDVGGDGDAGAGDSGLAVDSDTMDDAIDDADEETEAGED